MAELNPRDMQIRYKRTNLKWDTSSMAKIGQKGVGAKWLKEKEI